MMYDIICDVYAYMNVMYEYMCGDFMSIDNNMM